MSVFSVVIRRGLISHDGLLSNRKRDTWPTFLKYLDTDYLIASRKIELVCMCVSVYESCHVLASPGYFICSLHF